MGLFKSKSKEEAAAKITDFFSADDLSTVKELIGSKKAGRAYKLQYADVVDCLLGAVGNTETALGKKEVKKILFSTGTMTKIEPSLNPIFDPAIEKMRMFLK